MKGKIVHIVYMVALLVSLCGCQEDMLDNGTEIKNNYLTFTLSTRTTDLARVAGIPEEGEDRFNENRIERADVYFFADNSDNATCVYAQMDLTPSRINTTQYSLQVPLDRELLTNPTYYVYVIANSDDFASPTDDITLKALKEITISTEWKKGYAADNVNPITDASQVTESSLAMDGGANITLDPASETMQEIDMTRAMAKVMLFPNIEKSIVVGDVTYTPVLSGMNVTIVYGVNKTNFQGNYSIQEADYIDRIIRGYNMVESDEGNTVYEQTVPFYSYPNPESTSNRKDTYLILCVPWNATVEGSQQAVKYYYRVPISGNDAPAVLTRNTYYRIKVNVGVLGSLNPHDAVELTDKEFEIMPWISTSINADMNNYRYLVLEEYNSVMNNVDVLEMPYVSSSEIDLDDQEDHDGYYTKITEVSFWDYRDVDAKHVYYGDYKYNYEDEDGNQMEWRGDIPSEYQIDVKGTNLEFTHVLDEQDYVAITIKITAYNKQGVPADEWTITQYPAMYIEGEKNENGTTNRFVNGTNGPNGRYTQTETSDNRRGSLGTIYDLYEGNISNRNPNQYTIFISSFDTQDNYIIGDPRSDEAYEFDGRLDASSYRATKRTNVNNMVSPAFKIASSWGASSDINYDVAVRRCAAYQENGYPAGRWRLPTEAEIKYVVSLSKDEKIPELFNGSYWASSGNYYRSSNEDFYDGNSAYIRCVYDVWYWSDEKIRNPNEFTWGDANSFN